MMIATRSAIIYPIVLLSLLGLITAWINHVVQPPQPALDGSSRHDPDYIMRKFVTTQTDINGDLRYKLAAVEMKHFPDDDTTELQRPRYTQFAVAKPYTQVHALRGYVSGDGNEIQLVDNVKVTRQALAGKGEMTIDTEYLKILPDEDLVRTDSPVVIRQAPKTVIHATGMVYEKSTHTVTLLHKVRAHYEKPDAKKPSVSKASTNKTSATKSSQNNTKKNTKKSTEKNTAVKKPNVKATPNNSPPDTTNTRTRRRYES